MKYSSKKPPGEGFKLSFAYTFVVSVGLFVYLVLELSKPAPIPEEEPVEEIPVPPVVVDDYVPNYNTSGDSDWHWGFCLIVTLVLGIFALASPTMLAIVLKCVIFIRHGRDALIHNVSNEDEAAESKVEEQDEEAKLVTSHSTAKLRKDEEIKIPRL
jgi:hypothetical protein